MSRALRVPVALAGLMGAAGVVLAAMASHDADTARLSPASTMLLFHACAVLGAVALAAHGVIQSRVALIGACGFVVASALFAGDLVMRHATGERLFPFAAPAGGTLLILSWLVLTLAAAWPRRG
jgi:uncharacterized membrane protein YgdD (TMEM256/DUF423 family)